MSDLRAAFRTLKSTPGFTAIAILTLALGIGVNTAIFSVIKSVLLAPLPYPDFARIVVGFQRIPSQDRDISTSYPNFQDFDRDNRSFEHLAVYRREGLALTGLGAPERLQGAIVSHDFFSVLGLQPQLGRLITAEDDRPEAAPVVLLSERLWRRRFNADPDILGRTLTLNQRVYTVIGVMPPELTTPRATELWVPIARWTTTAQFQSRGNHPGLYMLGKLKPGVSLAAAIADLNAISARLAQQFPDSNAGIGANAELIMDSLVGRYREGLYLLLGAVALVLIIACANLANLLLARSAARTQEFAVRAALGATRTRLARQLLTESLLLALAGGLAGLLLAQWARDFIVALAPPGVPRFQQIALDAPVLAFSLGLALFTGIVFGAWPAWRSAQTDVREALATSTRGSSAGRTPRRIREALIIGEIALTLTLLVGAALLIKSFARAQSVDLGFDDRNLLLAQVSLNPERYPDATRRTFAETLLERIRALPGVTHATLGSNPPLNTGWQTSFQIGGRPPTAPDHEPSTEIQSIGSDYFTTLGVPILRGRGFDARDAAPGAPRAVIIDEAFAKRHWPGQDALGQVISMWDTPIHVVGIVPTLRVYGYRDTPTLVQAYVPHAQYPNNTFTLLVRTATDPLALRQPLSTLLASLDPDHPLYNVRTMRDDIARTFTTPRLYTYLLTIFATLALLLATLGLYGVISYSAGQRTREIGIRVVLGALQSQILALILRDGLRVLALGVVLGLALTALATRALQSLLFDVSPNDPLIYAAVILGIGAVATFACLLPARRAARLNPLTALRSE